MLEIILFMYLPPYGLYSLYIVVRIWIFVQEYIFLVLLKQVDILKFTLNLPFWKITYVLYTVASTLCLLVSSVDNLCKQFGPRSGLTTCRAWSGFKLFDTLMVFLKEFFENVDFEKNQQTT